MKKKRLSKKGTLFVAVLWTVTTALWSANAFLRILRGEEEGLLILTMFTLLASAAACVANWYRYANYEEE